MRLWRDGMPAAIAEEIDRESLDLQKLKIPEAPIDAVHLFVTERKQLQSKLDTLMPLLALSGFIWVSWPKKASKVPSEVSENVVREVALPMGLVDIKVCSVDEIWSGLKLVKRKRFR